MIGSNLCRRSEFQLHWLSGRLSYESMIVTSQIKVLCFVSKRLCRLEPWINYSSSLSTVWSSQVSYYSILQYYLNIWEGLLVQSESKSHPCNYRHKLPIICQATLATRNRQTSFLEFFGNSSGILPGKTNWLRSSSVISCCTNFLIFLIPS